MTRPTDNIIVTITVRMGTSVRFTIETSTSSTVLELKQLIANEEASGKCEITRQHLIYKGRILTDVSRTLSDYGLFGDNQTIHLVRGSVTSRVNADGSNDTRNVTQMLAPTGSPTLSNSTTSRGVSSNELSICSMPNSGSLPSGADNPFISMYQVMHSQREPGVRNFSDLNQTQQQLSQSPEVMSSMLNSPIMQNIMSNPDIIRNMMDSNPQMRHLLQQNPELRHILDDPETMRRSMEMMRDPSAMQNMMRNQDLAMSQIENIPGGFSALRRMYEDFQEPMMDALSDSGSSMIDSPTSSNAQSNISGSRASGTAMPNPWSRNVPPRTETITSQPTMSFNPWGSSSGSPHSWPPGAALTPNANLNVEQAISTLENPAVSQMMNQIMSDPSMLQTRVDNSPIIRQLSRNIPEADTIISDPEMIRAMMNPDNLRTMLQMQNATQQGRPNSLAVPSRSMYNNDEGITQVLSTTEGRGDHVDFSTLLNHPQSCSVSRNSMLPQGQQACNKRFHLQLQFLSDMGFGDTGENTKALNQADGNVNQAIDSLLSGRQDSSRDTPTILSNNELATNQDDLSGGGATFGRTDEKKSD